MISQENSNNIKVVSQFSDEESVQEAQTAIEKAGLTSGQIKVQIQNFLGRTEMAETQAVKSAKGGAIAGGIFGGLTGFFFSLIASRLFEIGSMFSSPNNFIFGVTLLGSAVGAAGFGLIAALSGVNAPRDELALENNESQQRYLMVVEGNEEEVNKATEIIRQKEGKLIPTG